MITENKNLGFATSEQDSERDYSKIKSDVMSELKRAFRPEFLNRIDDIIVFRQLAKEDIREISEKMLDILKKRMKSNDIIAEFSDNVIDHIAEVGFDPVFGARPLRRAIQSEIEDMLAEKMLSGEIKPESTVNIDYQNGKFVVG